MIATCEFMRDCLGTRTAYILGSPALHAGLQHKSLAAHDCGSRQACRQQLDRPCTHVGDLSALGSLTKASFPPRPMMAARCCVCVLVCVLLTGPLPSLAAAENRTAAHSQVRSLELFTLGVFRLVT